MGEILNCKDGRLYLNDNPFYLVSGDMHYFRVHPSQWSERLKLMRDFGLTAVQTYCPWNLHEPKRGEYNFSGLLDLGKFLDTAAAEGLKVLLRPAPYICSEWDFGGLPAWLLYDNIPVRTHDPKYLEAVDEYYREICKVIVPRLSTNGGPVIAVALENEYGGAALDREYLVALRDMLCKYGIDVPLYTTDGLNITMLHCGTIDGVIMRGINFRSTPGLPARAKELHQSENPGMPFFIGELWAGRSMHWGEPFEYRKPEETAVAFKEALEAGAYVNFYMFSGGTNFGFMSGANYGRSYSPRPDTPVRYIPITTSYDCSSPISEYGEPTEEYYMCRDVLDEFTGRAKRTDRVKRKAQNIGRVELSEAAYLFDNLDVLAAAKREYVHPLTMEDMRQDYGFIMYRKHIPFLGTDAPQRVGLFEVRDRATVYADGKYIGHVMRDRVGDDIKISVPENGTVLCVLVENVARLNNGKMPWFERKGITQHIDVGCLAMIGWETISLPLNDISRLHYKATDGVVGQDLPVFMKGRFDAAAGVDTFVHMEGFTKGCVWINGFNIGRYWNVGPQMTLYVPGALLKDSKNTIEIFDVEPKGKTYVELIDRHLLEMD